MVYAVNSRVPLLICLAVGVSGRRRWRQRRRQLNVMTDCSAVRRFFVVYHERSAVSKLGRSRPHQAKDARLARVRGRAAPLAAVNTFGKVIWRCDCNEDKRRRKARGRSQSSEAPAPDAVDSRCRRHIDLSSPLPGAAAFSCLTLHVALHSYNMQLSKRKLPDILRFGRRVKLSACAPSLALKARMPTAPPPAAGPWPPPLLPPS